MKRAYYSSSIKYFCGQEAEKILGRMTQEHSFDLAMSQRDAWNKQTKILKETLRGYEGRIYFEFSIPRMGRRVDAVVIIDSVIFVIEFKVGSSSYAAADLDQVMDYTLDMQNFHEGSHDAVLVPILVATDARSIDFTLDALSKGQLLDPISCNADSLSDVIDAVLRIKPKEAVDSDEWEASGYKPTPTIIEATLALYNGHSVSDISRSDASEENLSITSTSVSKIIEHSKQSSKKSIVIVSGVPGAGKTLVGLDIATTHINPDDELYSVFLSGNGPLVKILQEALARDRVARSYETGKRINKGVAVSEVKAFIQNVHHFRDDGLVDLEKPPIEHVALFDEAQRAWSKEQTIKFMREKKSQTDFSRLNLNF